jgi:hypothetical protein
MNSKLLLGLALVLSGGLFGCSTNKEISAKLPIRYYNAEYGFVFYLPTDWQGHSVLTEQWQAGKYTDFTNQIAIVDHGPTLILRHPKWKASEPYQDIPIDVFTRNQWDKQRTNGFILRICGFEDEIEHNSHYVFAIYTRFNAEDNSVKAWKEVYDIVAHNQAINKPLYLDP